VGLVVLLRAEFGLLRATFCTDRNWCMQTAFVTLLRVVDLDIWFGRFYHACCPTFFYAQAWRRDLHSCFRFGRYHSILPTVGHDVDGGAVRSVHAAFSALFAGAGETTRGGTYLPLRRDNACGFGWRVTYTMA
jgi:hypothetical protein